MAAFPASQRDDMIQEWKRSVDLLLDQVDSWARQESGRQTERQVNTVTEEALGAYDIEDLIINTPQGRVHLDPVERIVFSGPVTVELYAWPTLFRVRLLQDKKEGAWRVLTDSGIALRQAWNRDNFITLVKDLLSAQ